MQNPALIEAIILARTLELVAQAAHHLAKGPTFPGDHELFADSYTAGASAYDDLVEAAIKADSTPRLSVLLGSDSAKRATGISTSPEPNGKTVLRYELDFQLALSKVQGDRDLTVLCDDINRAAGKRVYKLQQRFFA